MPKLLSFLALLVLVCPQARADSFDLVKDGKNYHCEQTDNGGGSCWDKCPYGFSSCKGECGGGDKCWEKCPYGFSSCKSECGASDACWDKCPYGFSSCKGECGGGNKCWEKCPYGFSSCANECGPKAFTPFERLRFDSGRLDALRAERERSLMTARY